MPYTSYQEWIPLPGLSLISYVPFEEGSRDDYLGSEDIHIIFVYISVTRINSMDAINVKR